ncbi:S8 family serine peptidase [Streptomyces sp. NPDC051569]|uniref:S8 family peptidase n=1 Tax=Streptomyces sp. NPDC051569 TaxID=3365661 RepID=UPI003793B360
MRLRARWAPTALLLLIPLISANTGTAQATPEPQQSLVPVGRSAHAVPGQYIVTLRPAFSASSVLRQLRLKPLFSYGSALRGFAADLTPDQLRVVRAFPAVQAVEENGSLGLGLPGASEPGAEGTETGARTGTETGARTGAAAGARTGQVPSGTTRAAKGLVKAESWGLDRIDQRYLPLDGQFTVKGTGKGVTAYIVDTGIETANSEFGGRATVGFDAVNDGRNGQDCHFHGTHVAGTTGGETYGVARDVSLVSVRVLDCEGQGSTAQVIAGFDWVAANAKQPAVLNASVGGDASQALDDAANAVADMGVLPVVAAGNDAKDACGASPARATKAVTVGATDQDDHQATFSNFGTCLTTYAPGVAIVSANLGGGSRTLNGTSMASPHVAGVVALLKEKYPKAAPADVTRWLTGTSTKNVVSPIGTGSPNRLLYTGGL